MSLSPELSRPGLSFIRLVLFVVVGLVCLALGSVVTWFISRSANTVELISPVIKDLLPTPAPNPYAKYRFSELEQLQLTPGSIKVESVLDTQPSYSAFTVSWDVPDLDTGSRAKVTGQLNIPEGDGPFPVVVMLRGYADREIYSTGLGTRNAAAVLARNGFITIAPDFLGYGGSSPESNDVLLARFSRPVTVLQLLKNLENLKVEMVPAGSNTATGSASVALPIPSPPVAQLFDTNRLGIWAHSNGGQIALSILEITNRAIPTTLWAPVSQKFPYSVLYYTNDLADGGKYLRQQLANFEFTLGNDSADFSILTTPERIIAPIQIHQGGADEAVPQIWSETLSQTLNDASTSAQLFVYPAADHNLQPNWNEVVQRDLIFFTQYLR